MEASLRTRTHRVARDFAHNAQNAVTTCRGDREEPAVAPLPTISESSSTPARIRLPTKFSKAEVEEPCIEPVGDVDTGHAETGNLEEVTNREIASPEGTNSRKVLRAGRGQRPGSGTGLAAILLAAAHLLRDAAIALRPTKATIASTTTKIPYRQNSVDALSPGLP